LLSAHQLLPAHEQEILIHTVTALPAQYAVLTMLLLLQMVLLLQ
jgi:hypothetical protein